MVCCHKKDFFYDGKGYFPIQVGKALSSVDLEIQGDDTGENISEKNPNFCELTAHYWLWKKGIETKYVGLNHYRRYFDFKQGSRGYFFQNMSESNIKKGTLDLPDNLDLIFQNYDLVLANPMHYPISIGMHYCIKHDKDDLKALRDIIRDKFPEYIESFDFIINGNKLSLCNMFIMNKALFDSYSEWLFNLLFALEKRNKCWSDQYQSRVFGFLSERLLNVYVHHNRLRVKYYPIIKISEDRPLNNIKGYLKNWSSNIIYTILKRFPECQIKY